MSPLHPPPLGVCPHRLWQQRINLAFMDQVLKNQVTRANPHILSQQVFFFPSEKKKKVFLHFLGFLCWDFFFPLPLASSIASGVDNSRKAFLVPRHLPSLSSPYRLGLWPEQTGQGGPTGSRKQEVGKGLRRPG